MLLALVAALALAAPPAPDGPIAFENRENGELYAVQPDGRGLHRLTHTAVEESTPAWSPDAQRLAFVAASDLWTMNADGSGRKRLTRAASVGGRDRISWSPDGRWIAFTGRGDRLVLVRSDGSARKTIRTPGPVSSPAWSPNGQRIAFAAAARWKGHQGIWTVPAAGGAGARLTRVGGSGWDIDPTWSPDGSRLAFERQPAVGSINVLVRTGGKLRPLTHGFFNAIAPQWSPDGQLIAFGGGRSSQGGNELWVAPAGGGTPRRVVKGVDVGELSWARGPG